jgi:hypothetical protein
VRTHRVLAGGFWFLVAVGVVLTFYNLFIPSVLVAVGTVLVWMRWLNWRRDDARKNYSIYYGNC